MVAHTTQNHETQLKIQDSMSLCTWYSNQFEYNPNPVA
jgi:hypothetical protein